MSKRFLAALFVAAALLGFAASARADLTQQYSSSWTIQNGSTVYLTIDTNGNVVHGQGAALAQGFTNGATYIPICSTGAPNGTPTAFAGSIPLVVGGDNNLYMYVSAAWTKVNGSASTPAWSSVLAAGATTGSNNPSISNGQSIVFRAASAVTDGIGFGTGASYSATAPTILGPSDVNMVFAAGNGGVAAAGQNFVLYGGTGNAATAGNGARLTLFGTQATGQAAGVLLYGGLSAGTNVASLTALQIQAPQSTGNATPGTITFSETGIGSSGTSAQAEVVVATIAGPFNNTSGSTALWTINPTWADAGTTSTTVARTLALTPTYNYTAASKTGNTEALFINPTETSAPAPAAPTANNLIHAQDGGTERFSVTTGGQCGINMQPLAPGNASSSWNGNVLSVNQTGASGSAIATYQNSADTVAPEIDGYKSRSTVFTSGTAVLQGDNLLRISGFGATATSGATFYESGCSIYLQADGTYSNSSSPGRITLATTPSGSTGALNRWCVQSTGPLVGTSGLLVGFASSSDPTVSPDTAISRVSAGLLAVGTGAQGSEAGTLGVTTITSPGGTNLTLQRAATTTMVLVNSPLTASTESTVQFNGANAATYSIGTLNNSVTVNSGTSVNLAVNLPAGSQVIGCAYRITTTVTGPTGSLQLQDSTGNVYLTQTVLTSGTTIVGGDHGNNPGAWFNNFYSSANTFKIVSTATAFTGGVVEVTLFYSNIVAPTS